MTCAWMDQGHRASSSYPLAWSPLSPSDYSSLEAADAPSRLLFKFPFNFYSPSSNESILFGLVTTPFTPLPFLLWSLKHDDLFPAWDLCLFPSLVSGWNMCPVKLWPHQRGCCSFELFLHEFLCVSLLIMGILTLTHFPCVGLHISKTTFGVLSS